MWLTFSDRVRIVRRKFTKKTFNFSQGLLYTKLWINQRRKKCSRISILYSLRSIFEYGLAVVSYAFIFIYDRVSYWLSRKSVYTKLSGYTRKKYIFISENTKK